MALVRGDGAMVALKLRGAEKPKAESSTVIATGLAVDYIQSAPSHHRPDRFLVVVSANWGINQAVAVT